jgi:Ran GTPase-activating protein (RanGAP) involved in mRNA processing and transport
MCIHCEALSSCASLTYMSFPGIVAKIKKMTKTLTHICPYETYFGWKAAQIIADAMKYNTYVTYLRLGNNIGDGGAEALVLMLEHNTTLKVLDLSGNSSITARGVTFLANALKKNTTLTTLILSMTNVKQKACVALSSMLAVNETLTTLDVSCNNIGDRGVKALLEFIRKSNHSLTTLSIANNRITSAGANVLAETVRDNTTLTSIDISNNNFEVLRNITLMNALESNYSLTTFKNDIVSSEISNILVNNKYRKLYITLMLLFSAYGSIVPSLVVKRIVDDTVRIMHFYTLEDLK